MEDAATWFEDRNRTGNTIIDGVTFLRRVDYVRWEAEDARTGEAMTLTIFGISPIPILFRYIYDGFNKEVIAETPNEWSDVISKRIFPTSPAYKSPPEGIILAPPTCHHYKRWLRMRVGGKKGSASLPPLIPGKHPKKYEGIDEMEKLVRDVRGVDPIALWKRDGTRGAEYVKEAYVITEILSAMKDTRSVWIDAEHLIALRSSDSLVQATNNLVSSGVISSYDGSIALKWAADQIDAFLDRIGYDYDDLKFIHDPKVKPKALSEFQKGSGPEFRFDAFTAIDAFIEGERVPITAIANFEGEDNMVWKRPYPKPLARLRDEMPARFPKGVVRVIYTTNETDMNSVYTEIGNSLTGRTLVVSDGPCGAHLSRNGSYTCIVTADGAFGVKKRKIILVEDNIFQPDKYTVRADGKMITVPKLLVHETTRKVQATRPQLLPFMESGSFEHVVILSGRIFHERWASEAYRVVGGGERKDSIILVLR